SRGTSGSPKLRRQDGPPPCEIPGASGQGRSQKQRCKRRAAHAWPQFSVQLGRGELAATGSWARAGASAHTPIDNSNAVSAGDLDIRRFLPASRNVRVRRELLAASVRSTSKPEGGGLRAARRPATRRERLSRAATLEACRS